MLDVNYKNEVKFELFEGRWDDIANRPEEESKNKQLISVCATPTSNEKHCMIMFYV